MAKRKLSYDAKPNTETSMETTENVFTTVNMNEATTETTSLHVTSQSETTQPEVVTTENVVMTNADTTTESQDVTTQSVDIETTEQTTTTVAMETTEQTATTVAMETTVIPTTTTAMATTTTQEPCDPPFELLGGGCYWASPNYCCEKTWSDAETECQNKGANVHLVRMETSQVCR